MTADGDAAAHASNMIHAHIGLMQWQIRSAGSYLEMIDKAAAAGAFLHPESTESINLANDVRALRKLASDLEARRAELISNTPEPAIAAE